ncbi:MAG: hypothetical protein ABSD56_00070 [Bryobacteraceae bacterium]
MSGFLQPAHLMAILRGWYPHWQMQLRSFSVADWTMLALLLVVYLNTAWSLNRKR